MSTVGASKHDFVRRLGADEVIDHRAVDFGEVVRDIDLVLEVVGGDYAERSLRVLRPGGLLVTAVERGNLELAKKTESAGRRFAGISVEPDYMALQRLTELVEAASFFLICGRACRCVTQRGRISCLPPVRRRARSC